MRRVAIVLALSVVWFAGITADSLAPLLLQKPTLSRTHIAFVYAGDLWTVPRDGGAAQRLTSGAGVETNPVYSPDGSTIAFTGEYDGNTDVYTVPAAGPDLFGSLYAPSGLAEDRYIKAIQTRPVGAGTRKVVHHALTFAVEPDANTQSTAALVRGLDAPSHLRAENLPARLVASNGTVCTLGGWPTETEAS